MGPERGPPAGPASPAGLTGAFSSSLSPSSILACFQARPCSPQVSLCLPPAPLPSSPGASAASAQAGSGRGGARSPGGPGAARSCPPAGGGRGRGRGRAGGGSEQRCGCSPPHKRHRRARAAPHARLTGARTDTHTQTHRRSGTHGHTDALARTHTHGAPRCAVRDARREAPRKPRGRGEPAGSALPARPPLPFPLLQTHPSASSYRSAPAFLFFSFF